MILDIESLFSKAQDLTAISFGNSAYSTNTIDLQAGITNTAFNATSNTGYLTDSMGNTLVADAGKSPTIELLAQMVETATSGGAATLTVDVVESANANLSSHVVLHSTPALALATLVAGYQFRIAIPNITKRYIGLRFTVGTANFTAGKVTAGIVLQKQTNYAV